MPKEVLTNWKTLFNRPILELTDDELKKCRHDIMAINVEDILPTEYKQFLELCVFLLIRMENENQSFEDKSHQRHTKSAANKKENGLADFLKNSDIEESHYIQTIQDLNREIAQNVYSRGVKNGGGGDTDSLRTMGIDTKKDLLFKIHMKNKYIKRLLCENESFCQEIETLKEKNIQLDICLKQTTDRLIKANSDLMEIQRQNTISTEDIAGLNNKIKDINQQMVLMEKEKLKYRNDILFLGQEIHKRVDKWNDTLRNKCNNFPGQTQDEHEMTSADMEHKSSIGKLTYDVRDMEYVEISVLSQAVNRRNVIISELEDLLTDLTMEISHSAEVINNIIKNVEFRETNVEENLEKLRAHLSNLLLKQSGTKNEHNPINSKRKIKKIKKQTL